MKKLVLLIKAMLIIVLLNAQDTSAVNFTFNHLAISVKDVNRSADFYKKVLGLQEITNRSQIEGVRWFVLSDGKELHLISAVKEPVTTNKAIHLALTTSGFDTFVKTLDALKITYSDWPGNINKINIRADGVKQVFFQDPDGYWLEVNSIGK
jgi:catechol 2,3-dioxygenase-like lactoylglutathione lyase family enzyme